MVLQQQYIYLVGIVEVRRPQWGSVILEDIWCKIVSPQCCMYQEHRDQGLNLLQHNQIQLDK